MPPNSPRDFFGVKRNTAEIKAEILMPFVRAWCSTSISKQNAADDKPVLYIDLNALANGPDETLAILEAIYSAKGTSANFAQKVCTWFYTSGNEADASINAALENPAISESLSYQPMVLTETQDPELLHDLPDQNQASLIYLEPFSFKYTSVLPSKLIANPGADLFMLFSDEELKAAFSKKKVSPVVEVLLQEQLPAISSYFKSERNAVKRSEFILENLETSLLQKGYYPLKFTIGSPDKNEFSHYLVVACKLPATFASIKEILLPYSDHRADGVPLFTINLKNTSQLSLFPDDREQSVANLAADLSKKAKLYNYKLIDKIYEHHHTGTRYIKDNYKDAIERMRDEGIIMLLNSKTMQPIKKATYTSMVKYKV
ncbi:hypothetical protein [Pontibacter vulgaris]|uniref:hypothetical protein n=1 Tax=Pontibacter vulgaris TaxID=2905679 RepID=UPI001FA723B0|nr:hypothetical protein [Pontibacter vulgaris]